MKDTLHCKLGRLYYWFSDFFEGICMNAEVISLMRCEKCNREVEVRKMRGMCCPHCWNKRNET
jgi:hypothetical protein